MKKGDDPLDYLQDALAAFQDGLAHLQAGLDQPGAQAAFADAATLILNMQGRLILAGIGKSGHVARKLAATFASTGTPSYFVHPAEASHGDMGMIVEGDVLMLLSWSGETRELSDMIAYATRFGVPMIAMTGDAGSTLAKRAKVALTLPQSREACPHNLAPTTSTLLQHALGDALAVTLLQMRGFSESSFRDFHPGGKLGAALSPVRDVMHSGDDLPLLSEDAPMLDAIAEISAKGFGIVGLMHADGRLTGVITDGDIRRYLDANSAGRMEDVLQATPARKIMTPGSVTVDIDMLSARALHILQSNRISGAFVVDQGNPVGLITVLRLLQQGVA